ncbi:TIGR00270 family protein [Desulfurococcaceae archaeon MEX13E-LK6-19]|nr:TIGR00270 family protein [Desulfurococcaceae archaeon MEX13E-LK6-19]
MPCYCEMCGREIPDERLCKTIVVEGALLRVCPSCYSRLAKQKHAVEQKPIQSSRASSLTRNREREKKWVRARIPKRLLEEEFDIVPDYGRRIREARQRLGWSTKVLAEKVREKENVIKRIESGKLKPSIDLARRLEKVLHIKLLEPVVEESTDISFKGDEDYFTIGDLIKIKSSKK